MSNPRHSAQFGIRTALALLAAFAVGASVLREEGEFWSTGALLVVATCFAIGLSQEAYDICRRLGSSFEMSREERDGLRLAMAWRVGIVLLLVGHYVVDYVLIRGGVIKRPDNSNLQFIGLDAATVTHPVLYVAMIVVVVSLMPVRRQSKAIRWWRRAISYAMWPLIAFVALFRWTDGAHIHALVFIAVRGVENAMSLRAYGEQQAQLSIAAACWWPELSGAAATCSGLALIALTQAVDRGRPRAWRLLWIVVLAITLPVALALVWRLFSWVLPNLSKSFAEATFDIPAVLLCSAVTLILIMATSLAIHIAVERERGHVRREQHTNTMPHTSLHMRRLVALLAASAGGCWLIEFNLDLNKLDPTFSVLSRVEWLIWSFTSPFGILIASFTLLSGYLATFGASKQDRDYGTVRRWRFITIWLLCLVTATAAVISIVSASMAFWVSDWFQTTEFPLLE